MSAEDLLAVIHRDGGHYTREVGFAQSCRDAEQVVLDLRAEVARLIEELAQERSARQSDLEVFQTTAKRDREVIRRLTEELGRGDQRR